MKEGYLSSSRGLVGALPDGGTEGARRATGVSPSTGGAEEPTSDPRRKLEVRHSAVRHTFPSGDIQQMLAEIEQGYLSDNVQ